MADLDAELLALAGGDSSDEEDTKPTSTSSDAKDSPNSPRASNTPPTQMYVFRDTYSSNPTNLGMENT